MFTQAQAIALRAKIHKEIPNLDVQIQEEEPPYVYYYYLVVSQEEKIRFVVRSEAQWQERKRLIIV